MSWQGHYQYSGKWYPMTFSSALFDYRGTGIIKCTGHDTVGEFTMEGGFQDASNRFEFTKHYIGQHDIYYTGAINPNNQTQILGFWGAQPKKKHGFFRLIFK